MKNYRSLLLAFAALLGAALSARAQLVDVLTEAPVTIQATIQSTVTTTTPTAITTTSTTTRLTNLQVIQDLIDSGIIIDTSPVGWSLVAVRTAPPDLYVVDAGFALYAIKNTTVVAVPSSKFATAFTGRSVAKYTERNQGRYIYSSSGTVTNHVVYNYTPKFTTGTNTYELSESETGGFAKVNFIAKDFADDYEIFFYGISSVSAVTKGGFAGTITPTGGSPTANTGLFTLTITLGAAKLVPAAKYPDVAP